MVRFGGTVTLRTVVIYIAYNTEKILLGRFWGAASLGLYGRAYQIATLPVQPLFGPVHVVALSALSRIQRDARRLVQSHLKAQAAIISVTIPVVISSVVFAKEAVYIVLGPRWTGVVPVLRLLAPTVLVLALIIPFTWFLHAAGRAARSLKIALVVCPVVIFGIALGLRQGPSGVAFGHSAAMVVLIVPIVAWAIHGTGISATDYWDSIRRPLISGALGGVVGWLSNLTLQGAMGVIPRLVLGLGLSFAVYAGLLLFIMGQKRFYVDLLGDLFRGSHQRSAEG